MKSLELESRVSLLWSKPKEALVDQSTVGIDISESLPLSPLLSRIVGGTDRIDYVAWDFAGQMEYSTFHPVSKLNINILPLDLSFSTPPR